MAGQEIDRHWCDVAASEHRRCGDRERSTWFGVRTAGSRLGFLDLVQDAPAIGEVMRPGLAEPNGAGRAMQQPGTEPFL